MIVAAVNPWSTNIKACLARNIDDGVLVLPTLCPTAVGTVLRISCKQKSVLTFLFNVLENPTASISPIQVNLQ